MKVAVIRFPGSNCDQDAFHSLRNDLGIQAEYVWHDYHDLNGFEAVFLPGGFSYGDYLRCGAMAAHSPIMDEVRAMAQRGNPIIGACNGFQILAESGLLPGALLRNKGHKFICQDVYLTRDKAKSIWLDGVDRTLMIPIAHGEGRFFCDADTLKSIEDNNQVAFRYTGPNGELGDQWNPNGSLDSIAGVVNKAGNVLGLMPHPERATSANLGKQDGLEILRALKQVLA
ncbi:MAG: phosphoribosylformylglycinamidine synthase subunit PurQ [Armatimonadetes bacterium]|nr:phosphoribosylformylglycinamidine synthase subunit PurQ [Armatimonadota bacterium]